MFTVAALVTPIAGVVLERSGDAIAGHIGLTTNAVLHASTEFTVRVCEDWTAVRIGVSDRNTRMPQPCLTPGDATSGRGLAIIDGSRLTWGVERHVGGKTVWVQGTR